jgi:hypothetical protein
VSDQGAHFVNEVVRGLMQQRSPSSEYGLLFAGKQPGGKYEQDLADNIAENRRSKSNGLGP